MKTLRLFPLFTAVLILCAGVSAENGTRTGTGNGAGTGSSTGSGNDTGRGTDNNAGTGTGTGTATGTGTSSGGTAVSPNTRPVNPSTTPTPGSGTTAPVNPPTTPTPGSGTTAPVRPGTTADTTATTPIQTTGEQTWAQIRDYTFQQRNEFITGITRLDAQMERSIAGLKAKRSSFTGDPNVWDSEMTRLDDAHAFLKSTSADLAKATSFNWDDRKEKVSLAWERLLSAYERATGMATP